MNNFQSNGSLLMLFLGSFKSLIWYLHESYFRKKWRKWQLILLLWQIWRKSSDNKYFNISIHICSFSWSSDSPLKTLWKDIFEISPKLFEIVIIIDLKPFCCHFRATGWSIGLLSIIFFSVRLHFSTYSVSVNFFSIFRTLYFKELLEANILIFWENASPFPL